MGAFSNIINRLRNNIEKIDYDYQKVSFCAKRLDEVYPGWHTRVDMEKVKRYGLMNSDNCILAQVCSSYNRGMIALAIVDSKVGPFVSDKYIPYWEKVINERNG